MSEAWRVNRVVITFSFRGKWLQILPKTTQGWDQNSAAGSDQSYLVQTQFHTVVNQMFPKSRTSRGWRRSHDPPPPPANWHSDS